MKTITIAALFALSLTSCDVKVEKSDPGTPGKVEKKVETNTTIVNPPAKEEKKVEKTTTIIKP
jgi:hypothetical protein